MSELKTNPIGNWETKPLNTSNTNLISDVGANKQTSEIKIQINELTSEEMELEKEWERQANLLAHLFAKPLHLSLSQYIESLPRFNAQPPEFRGRLDTPIIVQPPIPNKGLPLRKLLHISRIYNSFYKRGNSYWPTSDETNSICDWVDDPHCFRTPEQPYITWINDRHEYLGLDRNKLLPDERAGGFEGISFYLLSKKPLNRGLFLPGLQNYHSTSALYLDIGNYNFREKAGIKSYHYFTFTETYNTVIAGRNIEI